jgi:hypothetical protein
MHATCNTLGEMEKAYTILIDKSECEWSLGSSRHNRRIIFELVLN